jgi:hypothetical protein
LQGRTGTDWGYPFGGGFLFSAAYAPDRCANWRRWFNVRVFAARVPVDWFDSLPFAAHLPLMVLILTLTLTLILTLTLTLIFVFCFCS